MANKENVTVRTESDTNDLEVKFDTEWNQSKEVCALLCLKTALPFLTRFCVMNFLSCKLLLYDSKTSY